MIQKHFSSLVGIPDRIKEDSSNGVLITGASAGIGAALANRYAAPDRVLWLSGRNAERLAGVGAQCRSRGAETHLAVIDVTDAAAISEWVTDAATDARLCIVIANAGVSGEATMSARQQLVATNIGGVVHTVEAAIPAFQKRGCGQIAVMASLAGYLPQPSAPLYAASKAAVMHYAAAQRAALAPSGIGVTAICPGFVDTAMTRRNSFAMPLMKTAPIAAGNIVHRLQRNPARIAFPWPLAMALRLGGWLPEALRGVILRRLA